MEIESKYVIPSAESLEQLKALIKLGSYTLKEPITKIIADTYLDTAEGLIRQGGFACRIRHDQTRGTWLGTMKGLGGESNGVHTREEFEVRILPHAQPRNWPRSEARQQAINLAHFQTLVELFSVHQTRSIRSVYQAERLVGEFSLDKVDFKIGTDHTPSWELEIELKEKGTVDDLKALNAALASYNLRPEPKSKFERGLALLELHQQDPASAVPQP